MLTDKQIQALKPREREYQIYDDGRRGDGRLFVRVRTGGSKEFYFTYSFEGSRRKVKLGNYVPPRSSAPGISLLDARAAAQELSAILRSGLDPQRVKQEQRREREAADRRIDLQRQREAQRGSMGELIDAYCDHLALNGKRTHEQVRNTLRSAIRGQIAETTMAREVTSDQICTVIQSFTDRNKFTMARYISQMLQAAFNFGMKSDYDPLQRHRERTFQIESNPVSRIQKPPKGKPGERDLSWEELQRLWFALSKLGCDPEVAGALRLMIALAGPRTAEVLGMRWEEIDLEKRIWLLPADRSKNSRANLMPLNNLAIDVLNSMRPLTGHYDLVFPSRAGEVRGSDTLSRAIKRFVASSNDARFVLEQKQGLWSSPMDSFTPRDLRRTGKTRMGELGIPKEIRDRLHNHAAQDVSAKHYDRYDYLPEKRDALDKWSNKICELFNSIDGEQGSGKRRREW